LTHAKAHLVKGKIDKALEEAQLALEADPTFEEARHFLADYHERAGETRKAVHQYEELLFRHPNDEELLARIERLDPMAAARHRRMGDIAPDPFVGGSRAGTAAADDLADMDEIDIPSGPKPEAVVVASDVDLADLEDMAAVEATAPSRPELHVDASEVFEDAPIASAAQAAVSPEQLEYDDERQCRESTKANPAVGELLRKQRYVWAERGALEELLAQTRPLTYTENEEAANAFFYCGSLLGVNATLPCVITDPSLRPLICGPQAAYVLIPTGAFEAFNATELYFLAGRTLARVACDHTALLDVTAAVLPPPRPSSRLLDLQRQAAAAVIGGAQALGDQATAAKIQQQLHMWRLRGELTADRAGLVCCQSPEDAASAIAKLTAADAATAQTITPEALEHRFAGQDLGQIAAIGLDRDPATSEPYAYYRVRMLKWWATQPAYAQLVAPSA
jgi:tetratricopeptide (TPR) repeat protein